MTVTVRAAVVDDATVVREFLPIAIPSVEFVSAHANVETLLASAPDVDVVVLDLFLSAGPARQVRQGRPAIRAVREAGYAICLYTEERRPLVLAQCLAAGAGGVVHKTDSIEATRVAIETVARGEVAITPTLIGVAELLSRTGKLPELTALQREVVSRRARGESWREVAHRLHNTEGVAQGHMRAAIHKFASFLRETSPGDLERALGIGPHDLLDEQP